MNRLRTEHDAGDEDMVDGSKKMTGSGLIFCFFHYDGIYLDLESRLSMKS